MQNIEIIKTKISLLQRIILTLQKLKSLMDSREIKTITIHHSASPISTTIEEINQWHKDRDFTLSKLGFYVGYHQVIFPDGHIIQTRMDDEIGCHTKNHNKGNIGICLIGNFNDYAPTGFQWGALVRLIDEKKKEYFIDNKEIKCHSDFAPTECPGYNLRAMVKTKYA